MKPEIRAAGEADRVASRPRAGTEHVSMGSALMPYVRLARPDHWVKNVFVLPGVVVALSVDPGTLRNISITAVLCGIISVCLISSSNYVINEVLDAPFDKYHPVKRYRPVPSGQVKKPFAYAEWLGLMIAGIAAGLAISIPFALSMGALWIMGCVYNIPPSRTKDLPYVDVLSEAINNPLRMLAGWYFTRTAMVPPASLLMSYWMVGSYFMAVKRFAEYREIADRARIIAYRKSFSFYTEDRLLVSIMFYAAVSMLFFGAFLMRYRMELVLTFPLVAWVMAVYLSMAFKEHSAAQHPEALYKERWLMVSVISCTVCMGILLFVRLPFLYRIFAPTIHW